MSLFNKIEEIISSLDVKIISSERKETLKPFIEFLRKKIQSDQEIRINFICTHNTRRSLLSQVWAQTFAYYFNISNLFCYSGGTESTALYPRVA